MRNRLLVALCLWILCHALGTGVVRGQPTGSIVGWGDQVLVEQSALEGLVAVAAGSYHSLGLKSDGTIVAWGYNNHGQCNVPTPNADFVAVAAGGYHSLGLKADGTIVAWGQNSNGQCNVPTPNAGFVAVAAGGSHSLGLKADGTIVAWGYNNHGQCNVPTPNAGFVAVAAGGSHSLGLKADGTIVAWGYNNHGQCNVPTPNADFVAVAAGGYHSLGLKADGTIVAWGSNNDGQCNVPSPNAGFVAVAAGLYHSLGLKADGTIVAWGYNNHGQCNVPTPNADFVAVAAGGYHSLGLKSDGTIVAWGYNGYGQCNVPPPNADFVAVAAGGSHSLGLKADGTIVAWGSNNDGQCNVPTPNAGFVAVAAGRYHSLGLKADGTIVAWGYNNYGQCNVPSTNADFVAVAAGEYHSLGLKSDGTIVAWGYNGYGQCNVPTPNADFVAVAAGGYHSLGLKADGTIVAWGQNSNGQCNVPTPNAGFVAVAAGGSHSLGLKADGTIVAWGNNLWGQCNVPPPNADFVAVAGGGNFSLATRSSTLLIHAVATTIRDSVFVDVSHQDQPYDDVEVQILEHSQIILRAWPRDGRASFGGLIDGSYGFEVRDRSGGGPVLAQGTFVIDLSNRLPVVSVATAEPTTVPNDGAHSVDFRVVATDPDGGISGVYLDLERIGGVHHAPMTAGQGEYVYTQPIGAAVAPNVYAVPVHALDDRGGVRDTTVTLSVTPAGGLADSTLTVLGYVIRASAIQQMGPTTYRASGNVKMTHESGLPLLLDATGAVTVSLDPPRIASEGEVTVKVDLAQLGVYDLFHGPFSIEADGQLMVDQAANYLLDRLLDYALDTDRERMDIDLITDPAGPGIRVTSRIILDALDGVSGNNLPVADVTVTALRNGQVSGSLSAGQGDIRWDLSAGTLSFTAASWENRTIRIQNATFEFAPGTFDESRLAVGVPEIRISPDGFDASGITVSDFAFHYGGFGFDVNEATLTNESFRVDRACIHFPLQGEDASSCLEGIVIAHGSVTLSGAEIRVPSLKVGTYDLAGIYAHFAKDESGALVMAAKGTLAIPAFATVDIEFALNSACDYLIERFCMASEFEGQGIPIGNTGMLLTGIGGCILDQGCSNAWEIRFTASFASADRIVPPDKSLVSGDVAMAIFTDPMRLTANGTVDLIGYRLATAGFDLYRERFHGYGTLELPPAVTWLRATTGLDIYWIPSFSFTGTADGTFQIPAHKIPGWPKPVELAGFHTQVDGTGVSGDFYVPTRDHYVLQVTARYLWRGQDFEFERHWNWPLFRMEPDAGVRLGVRRYVRTVVVGEDAGGSAAGILGPAVLSRPGDISLDGYVRSGPDSWFRAGSGPDGARHDGQAGGTFSYRDTTETIEIGQVTGPLVFHLVELPETTGVELGFRLVSPGGIEIDSTYCETHEGFAYAKAIDHIYYRIDAAESGVWQAVVSDIDPGESYLLEAAFIDQAPSVHVTEPHQDRAGTTTEDYPIAWSASDPEGSPFTASLYAMRAAFQSPADSLDPGPWLLAAGLPDTVSGFIWRPRTMRNGMYKVVATVDDGSHMTVADTCAFTITLSNQDPPAAPGNLRSRVGPECVRVLWDRVLDEDTKGYRLFWSADSSSTIDTLDVGNVDQFVIRSLVNYRMYRFWLEAYDVMDQTGPTSGVIFAAPTPLGDIEAPPAPSGVTALYDVGSNRVSVSWTEIPDAVGYRVHYDTDVIGAYGGTGAAEGDSPVVQERLGTLTLTGLAPGVLYYIAVSAFDAASNESPPCEPVAVLVSQFADTDQDGLPDDWEITNLGSLQYGPEDDPDGDLVTNLSELTITQTHPGRADTDGDQVTDGSDAHPLNNADIDTDGMPDDWETYYGVTDPNGEADNDGLINVREFSEHTSPWDPDTDADQLVDGFEVDVVGTEPWKWDTDGGGEWDGSEYLHGRNPLDPSDDDPSVNSVDGDHDRVVPRVTFLGVHRPNPFAGKTVIPYGLAARGRVRIQVYDIAGRTIRSLLDSEQAKGFYQVTWNGLDDAGILAPSGVYWIRMHAGRVGLTRKAILLR